MGQLDENQQDPIGNTPVDNQPGHHPEHEQDQPDLDEFAERFGVTSEDESGHGGALETVTTTALSLAGRARDLAEPVGRAVSERISQVTGAVDDYRHLAERVERLEAAVAELERDSTTTG